MTNSQYSIIIWGRGKRRGGSWRRREKKRNTLIQKLQHYSFHKQTEPHLKLMANSIIQAYLNSFALPLLTMIHYSVILW